MEILCRKCGSKMDMMVSVSVTGPASLYRNMTIDNLIKNSKSLNLSVNWKTTDFLCRNPKCNHVIDGLGNYITQLENENEILKSQNQELTKKLE